MGPLHSFFAALLRRRFDASDLRALWRGVTRRDDFVATAHDFAPTRWVPRADEIADGRAVHVGEGLEVSEEDLHTLPAELQAEFATQMRRSAGGVRAR